MYLKILAILMIVASTQVFSYSTLDCSSPKNITYISHSKVGGARPYPGMITHIEEIKQGTEVLYRKVNREECYSDEFCQNQQPELEDIGENTYFTFIQDSKIVIASEGRGNSPVKKETYAIKFLMDKEMWMLCESFFALYP
jgi:hypothetical protein